MVGNWPSSALAAHLTDEDPDEPKSTSDHDHETVKEKMKTTVVVISTHRDDRLIT